MVSKRSVKHPHRFLLYDIMSAREYSVPVHFVNGEYIS